MASRLPRGTRIEEKQEMEFLRDFDLLTRIIPSEQVLYELADLEKG